VTTREWNTACPDWPARIKAGASIVPALPLNKAEADRAERIFDKLRLPDVPGRPTLAEACGPWFRECVRALFGAYDPESGVRHLSEMFVLVPKKNSKTSYGAALMLVAMFMSRRPRAEFLLVAPTQEVADLAYSQAVGMIEADDVLSKKCHVQSHLKRIAYRTTGAFLKVKSFDPRVVTGSKPAGVLLDETHVIAEAHDADRVIGQLRGGLVSQPEGFLVQITTQSERPPSGVFLGELRKARAVRDGRLRAPMLPVLYEFPRDVDWRDKANWPMVLPNAGRSVHVERLGRDYDAAVEAGPDEVRRWASQHLNVEIGVALMTDAWPGALFWSDCADRALTLDALLERSEVVTVGIDGGGLDDMLGLCVLGRETGTANWLAWTHAWVHPIALERRKANAARYRDFEADGDLTIVESIGDDVREVAQLVERIEDAGVLDKIGVDPAGIGAIVDAIVDHGIEKDRIVGISQGWRLTGAIKTTERKLAEGALTHAGQSLMEWCAGNARVEQRGNAVLVTKQSAGVGKIDPLVALFCAAALMSMNPEARDYYSAGGELEVF
jgi:phage terminase large subunit-like protein